MLVNLGSDLCLFGTGEMRLVDSWVCCGFAVADLLRESFIRSSIIFDNFEI